MLWAMGSVCVGSSFLMGVATSPVGFPGDRVVGVTTYANNVNS